MCPQITLCNHTRNTAHSDVSRTLWNALQPRSVDSGYYIAQGEQHMEILSLAFIQLIFKLHFHPISVQLLFYSQHPCPHLVLSPSLISHLLLTIDNMVDLSFLWGLPPFFVHGRSTICTTVPLTSAVMLSNSRSLLLRRQVRYTERDASFSVLMNPLMKETKEAVSRNDDTLRTRSLNSNR